MKAIMISGRTLTKGAECESKMTQDYFQAAFTFSLSEPDYNELGQTEGRNILVRSRFGQVASSSRMDSGLTQGMIFQSDGPWANVLIGPDTVGCGMPHFNGIEVRVNYADSNVKDTKSLFNDLEGKTYDGP